MQRIIRIWLLIASTIAVKDTYGQQIVSWSETSFSLQALRGTTRVVNVSFITSQDLNDVDLFVVPELQPFLSATPAHFNSIAKNATVNISITFSISESAVPGTYDGVLKLRGLSKTFPLPLPITLVVQDPTSDVIPDGVALPSSDRVVIDRGVEFARDEIVVYAKPTATNDQLISLVSRFGATFLGHDEELHFYQMFLSVKSLDAVLTLLPQLEGDPIVKFAAPHFLLSAIAANTPNDPSWQSPSIRCFVPLLDNAPGAGQLCQSWAQNLIQLPDAWSVTTGNTSVKMGVVDAGFDSNHEDLAVDKPLSNLNLNMNSVRAHGTAVASIAVAVGNNSKGLAGAMWSSDLAVFSCGLDEDACVSAAKEAIDKGVKIINGSFGREFSPTCDALLLPGQSSLSDSQRMALFNSSANKWREVINHASGRVLFVFGAGNDNTSFNWFSPGALSTEFNNVMSVAAVDKDQNKASYSNYGNVDVWAPGGDAKVGMCPLDSKGNFTRFSNFFSLTDPPLHLSEIWTAVPDNNYDYGVGTSFATPFVSGVAGLMLSVNPNLTAAQLKNIIRETAVHTGKFDPSNNEILLLDASRAVQRAGSPVVSQISFSRNDFTTGPIPSAVVTADFNGDGDLDLAIVNSGSNTVSIMLGNGDGTFRARTDYSVGFDPISIAASDFNHDGKIDLAVARAGFACILLGNGDGTFNLQPDIAIGNGEGGNVIAGDFNKDGKPDLAITKYASSAISVLLGNGDGTFQAPVDYATGSLPTSIVTGDFDGNGTLDLASSNFGSGVSILLGNGDGTFQQRTDISILATSLALGDFNGDGKPDLVIDGGSRVTTLLGQGDGIFVTSQPFNFPFPLSGFGAPQVIAVGDFNSDGNLDVAVLGDRFIGPEVIIILGNGNGTFTALSEFATNGQSVAVVVADFNRDGKPDMVVLNDLTNTGSIFLNTSQ